MTEIENQNEPASTDTPPAQPQSPPVMIDPPVVEEPAFVAAEPMYALQFDTATGRVISRLEYTSQVENLPAGQVVCTKEQHDNHTAYCLVGGEIVPCGADELLEKAKTKAISAVNESCQRAFVGLVLHCRPGEFVAAVDQLIERRVGLTDRINAISDDSDAGINQVAAITWA